MTRKFLLLAGMGCLVLGGAAHAAEQTARELFETLPTQIRAEAEAKRNGKLPQGTGQSDPNYLLSFFKNARESLENGDENSAVQQLRQLEGAAATDPVRETCEAVVTRLRREHADKDAATAAEVAAVLQRAGEAVLKAKAPKDLDPALHELAAVSERRTPGRAYDRGGDTPGNRVQSAAKFVARWQDYLLSSSRNDARQVAEELRSMLAEVDAIQALNIPRSEIIGRLPSASASVEATPTPARRTVSTAEINAAIEAAFSRLKTLDDLPAAIHDLTAFRDETLTASNSYSNGSGELATTLSSLVSLRQSALEVQTGVNRWQNVWMARYENSNGGRGDAALVALRAQLLALSLPRILGAPDTEKPAPGERVDAFLDRLLAAAKKRGDWQAVARGVECRRTLAPNSAYDGGRSDLNGEEGAFKQFFAGQNFEQAAQYEQAVAAYLAALSTGAQEIPVAVISERLAAIKKDHPTEYAGGSTVSLPGSADNYRAALRLQRAEILAVTPAPSVAPAPTPAASPTASPK